MRPRVCGLLGLLASACLWGGSAAQVEVVEDRDVLLLVDRIERLYERLEGRPLDVVGTYEDPRLREFFATPQDFVDYYASLTSQLRDASFRHSRTLRIEIREFHFEGPDRARVEVILVGRHFRRLRFWEVRTSRTDLWQRSGSTWVLRLDRL